MEGVGVVEGWEKTKIVAARKMKIGVGVGGQLMGITAKSRRARRDAKKEGRELWWPFSWRGKVGGVSTRGSAI